MSTPIDNAFDFDPDRILADTFVKAIRYHESVDSTNNAAQIDCQSDELTTPWLVVARQQTAGRGRGSNTWWSAPGALTFSLVIRPAELGLSQSMWPKASLTMGLSVCLALGELLPNDDLALKWPNDVHLRRKKVCGVLVEVGPRTSETLVIGIGVNVNNSFQAAPAELRLIATSVADVTHQTQCLTGVLTRILCQIQSQIARLAASDPELPADWQRLCALRGRTLEINSGAVITSGVCQGIDDDGALVLLTEGGPTRLFAGVVTRIW